MSRRSFLPVSAPLLGAEEREAVGAVLRSGWLSTGRCTEEFEAQLCRRFGARHAVATSSCTAALHLSLVALGIGPGDEVAVAAVTYPATANVVVHTGARPILVDVDPETLGIAPKALEASITTRTRAVIVVHMAGLPVDFAAVRAVADRHALAVVEDAAHAVGAAYGDSPIGSGHGTTTCFSFHPTKNMTTIEGGALLTGDAQLAATARLYGMHGISSDSYSRFGNARNWEALVAGFKNNMTDVQAAVGLVQLTRLDGFLQVRAALAARYAQRLAGASAVTPLRMTDPGRAWHLYVVLLAPWLDRDAVRAALVDRGLGTGVHFRSLHVQPYFRERLRLRREDLPAAADVGDRVLSLPLHPAMTSDDVDRVADAVLEVTS